jgi:hypothetical protein
MPAALKGYAREISLLSLEPSTYGPIAVTAVTGMFAVTPAP